MNKKLLLLFGAYVGGVVVATMYNRKNPLEIKTALEASKVSGEKPYRLFLNNFIEIHKTMFDDVGTHVLGEENKKMIGDKAQEIYDTMMDYKSQGEQILKDLEVKGKDFALSAISKLEESYNQKVNDFEKMKDKAPEKYNEMKKKVNETFDDVKKRIKEK